MSETAPTPIRKIWTQDGATIVELYGELDLHRAPALRNALTDAVAARPRMLVVNFTEVKYIDSTGLGTLVYVFRKVKDYNGGMSLVGLSPMVRNVFEITKLLHIFSIHETVEEAVG